MNRHIGKLWNKASRYKYHITIVLGIVFVGFAGEDSVVRHVKNRMLIDDLEQEISKYRTLHARDSIELRQLRNNPKAIEKIARERYFMKADDEDIFVLSDGEIPDNVNERNE